MSSEIALSLDIAEVNRRLDGASPLEILRWGVETFFPKLTMATAFGPEGCVILHLLVGDRAAGPGVQPRHRLPVRGDAAAAGPDRRAVRDRGRAGPSRDDGRRVRVAPRRAALQPRSRTAAASTARSCRCGGRSRGTRPGSPRSGPTSRRTGRGRTWSAGTRSSTCSRSTLCYDGPTATSGRSSWPTTSPTTRCTTRAIPRSAAGPAPAPCCPGDRRAGRPLGGPGEDRVRPALARQQSALSVGRRSLGSGGSRCGRSVPMSGKLASACDLRGRCGSRC